MAADTQGDLLDGLWLLPDGQATFMDESQSDDPEALPFSTLCRLLPCLIGDSAIRSHLDVAGIDVTGIKIWLNENPSPGGKPLVDVIPNKANTEEWHWLDQLMIHTVRSGFTLIWRGCITTAIESFSELCMVLKSAEEHILQLGWPPDILLTLHDVGPHAGSDTCHSLDDLMGRNKVRADECAEWTPFSKKDGWIYDENGELYNPRHEYECWKQQKEADEREREKLLRRIARDEKREAQEHRERCVESSRAVQLPSILIAVLVFSLSVPVYLMGVHRAEMSGGDTAEPILIFFPVTLLALYCYNVIKRKRTSDIVRELRKKERSNKNLNSHSAQGDEPNQGS